MYGIFTYIYHKNQPNVGKYIIHGLYGNPSIQIYAPQNTQRFPSFASFPRISPTISKKIQGSNLMIRQKNPPGEPQGSNHL